MQSHVKSIYFLYNAHRLTLEGNYGIAGSLFRQVFEFQIICKYFYVINNDMEAVKWLNGSRFNIVDKVFKNLEHPSKKNLYSFWKSLCPLTHATTGSCQIMSEVGVNDSTIKMTYCFIIILLIIESYALNCIHNRDMMRHIKGFIGHDYYEEFKTYRQALKETIKAVSSGFLADSGIAVIKDYKSKWIFKHIP